MTFCSASGFRIGQKSKDWKALEEEIEVNVGETLCFCSHVSSIATFSHYLHVNIILKPDKVSLY